MQDIRIEFQQVLRTFKSACLAAKNRKDAFEASGRFRATAEQLWTREASQKLPPVQVQKYVQKALQEIDFCIKPIVDTTLELVRLQKKVTIH